MPVDLREAEQDARTSAAVAEKKAATNGSSMSQMKAQLYDQMYRVTEIAQHYASLGPVGNKAIAFIWPTIALAKQAIDLNDAKLMRAAIDKLREIE